jgi:DNA-binding NarL/FixJ family response regulator
MSPVFKIIIASENTFERTGVKNALTTAPDIEIVGEFPNTIPLPQNTGSPPAWIIITSIPDKSPSFENLLQVAFPVSVIACYPQFPPALIGQLKRRGVKGFVMTAASDEDLLEAIYTVGNGEEYYCPLTLQHLEAHHRRLLGPGSNEVVFTKKEMQVLELICQEFSDKEIATRTGTSRRTVETHKRNIRAKTKAYNNVGCINYARSQGIIFLQFLWVLLNPFADSMY